MLPVKYSCRSWDEPRAYLTPTLVFAPLTQEESARIPWDTEVMRCLHNGSCRESPGITVHFSPAFAMSERFSKVTFILFHVVPRNRVSHDSKLYSSPYVSVGIDLAAEPVLLTKQECSRIPWQKEKRRYTRSRLFEASELVIKIRGTNLSPSKRSIRHIYFTRIDWHIHMFTLGRRQTAKNSNQSVVRLLPEELVRRIIGMAYFPDSPRLWDARPPLHV